MSILMEPSYGYTRDGRSPHRPTLSEVWTEWTSCINFLKDRKKFPIFFFVAFHLISSAFFMLFLIHIDIASTLFLLGALFFLGNVYNTIWYHRYCSHQSFRFKSSFFSKVFLWSNPIVFREECYAIPHQIHHGKSDGLGDPYGPHLGWVGSYLAQESAQLFNVDITKVEYELLKKRISHVGIKFNSFKAFQETGSLENLWSYFFRVLFAQLMWAFLVVTVGGSKGIIIWYAALFVTIYLMRDFNWWGHGGNFREKKIKNWEFDIKSRALNQRFFGYLASEWHNNHHKFPTSANNGYFLGQPDIAFFIIKILKRTGFITSYNDVPSLMKKDKNGEVYFE